MTFKLPILICLFFAAILTSSSCSKMQLAKEDKLWNPYQVGNKLVFENDNGDQQTFYISEIESVKVRNNPYAGNLSGTRENQFTYFDTTRNSSTPKENALLAIGKDREKSTWISFVLNLPNVIDANHNITINELSKLPLEQKIVGNKSYDDIIVLHPINQGGNLAYPEVVSIWWSKAKGYVRYQLSTGEVWSLK